MLDVKGVFLLFFLVREAAIYASAEEGLVTYLGLTERRVQVGLPWVTEEG